MPPSQLRLDQSAFLVELSALIGGRPDRDDDGRTCSVRLPRRLGRGEIFFIDGQAKGLWVEIKGGSSLYLMIGGQGPRWDYNRKTMLAGEEIPVFYNPQSSKEVLVRQWLDGGGREAVKGLRLGPKDRVDVNLGDVSGFLSGRSAPADVHSFVEGLAALARSLPPPPRKRRPTVPAAFTDLQSSVKKWAITDDRDRNTKLRRASKQDLLRLVDAATPRLRDIDDAISAAEEPLSEDLIDLGSLAQAALEAEIELTRREGH
jgi:hypothetical protein